MDTPLRRSLGLLLAALATSPGLASAATAADDAYETTQGQVLTVPAPGVLGNDSAGATVTDNTLPMFGTLTLNSDGSFTYDPDDDFYGSDGFSYDATDGGGTDTALVSLTVTSSYNGGGGGGGGYGSGGALSSALLMLLASAALYRGLKPSKRRAISP